MRYEFSAQIWRHGGESSWHFLTLPSPLSQQIRTMAGGMMNAFGSLRVNAGIGEAAWKTSLFYDSKRNAFVLPVKAEVRRKAKIAHGDSVAAWVEMEL